MKKEIADKWVAALRSGEYQQGKRWLKRDDNSYCCLGVLCQVAINEGAVPDYDLTMEAGAGPEIREWSGLKDSLGTRANNHALYQLNDSHNYTFAQIADVIEAEWEAL